MDADRSACWTQRRTMQSLGICNAALLLVHSLLGQKSLLSWTAAVGSVGLCAASSWMLIDAKRGTSVQQNLPGLISGDIVVSLLAAALTWHAAFAERSASSLLWEGYSGCIVGVLVFFTQRLVVKCGDTRSLCDKSQSLQESNNPDVSKTSSEGGPTNHSCQTERSITKSVQRLRSSLIKVEQASQQSAEHTQVRADHLSFFRRIVSEDKANLTRRSGDKHDLKTKSRTRRRQDAEEQKSITFQSTRHPLGDVVAGLVDSPAACQRKLTHNSTAADKSTSGSETTTRGDLLRSVRFADDEGMEIETVFEIEASHNTGTKRVLVLLLLPKLYAYEFVAFEYDTIMEHPERSIVRVSQILEYLPTLASDPKMSRQKFVRLIRMDASILDDAWTTGIEMINSLSIQSYNLANDEILLAVPSESSKVEVIESSRQVVKNPKLVKALKRNKVWSKALPTLLPSQ